MGSKEKRGGGGGRGTCGRRGFFWPAAGPTGVGQAGQRGGGRGPFARQRARKEHASKGHVRLVDERGQAGVAQRDAWPCPIEAVRVVNAEHWTHELTRQIALSTLCPFKPDYISLRNAVYVPHTAGRYANKSFKKAQMPIVERLVNRWVFSFDARRAQGAGRRASRVMDESAALSRSRWAPRRVDAFAGRLRPASATRSLGRAVSVVLRWRTSSSWGRRCSAVQAAHCRGTRMQDVRSFYFPSKAYD